MCLKKDIIRYLEYYDLYSATTDTITIPDDKLEMIKYFCLVEYIDSILADQLVNNGALVKQQTYEAINNIINLRSTWARKAEQKLSRVKTRMPSTRISTLQYGMKS